MKNTYLTGGLVKRATLPPHQVTTGQHVRVSFNERKLVRVLAVTAAALVVVGFWSIYSVRFLPDFFAREMVWSLTYLNGETNLPALFSTLILLLTAAILGMIAVVKRTVHDPFARTWTGLALLAAYLGVDEGASLHEKLIEPVQKLIRLDGIFHYAWVVPYGLLALTVLVVCLRFLRHLPPGIRNAMILSGAIYVTGAFGLELVEGYVQTHMGRDSFWMEILIACEEAMEMAGVILMIGTLLRYIRLYLPGMEVRLGVQDGSGPRPG